MTSSRSARSDDVIGLCVVEAAANSQAVVGDQRQRVTLEQHGDHAQHVEQLVTAELRMPTKTTGNVKHRPNNRTMFRNNQLVSVRGGLGHVAV